MTKITSIDQIPSAVQADMPDTISLARTLPRMVPGATFADIEWEFFLPSPDDCPGVAITLSRGPLTFYTYFCENGAYGHYSTFWDEVEQWLNIPEECLADIAIATQALAEYEKDSLRFKDYETKKALLEVMAKINKVIDHVRKYAPTYWPRIFKMIDSWDRADLLD